MSGEAARAAGGVAGMCGIAGIWADGRLADVEAAVARMVVAQRHRGPDEERTVTVLPAPRPLVLGFDRLAILDLGPDASQPMHDGATGSWLVFNGEIYNFRALRAELVSVGHRFRSRGDTEVLLAALVRWGTAALPRLRGMYAFAFFDGRTRRLVLGRDPFGVKPLYYGRVGHAFVFASELRAVRAAALGPLALDGTALQAYLVYGAVPEPYTMAREVRVLPPGHVLEVDAQGGPGAPRPVLTLADFLDLPERAPEGWRRGVAEVGDTLEGAVAAHLVSDVPLGVLLSGGVDSTLVASLAARCGAGLQYLTVGCDEPRLSEVAVADATVRRLGGRHHVVRLRADDVLALLPDALAAMDQPTADGVNTFVITRAAAERDIKVLVSGLGGDELFGGYTSFRKAPLLAARARWLAPFARALAALGLGNVAQWSKVSTAAGVHELREAYVLQRALDADVHAQGALPDSVWSELATAPGLSDFRRVSYLELTFYMRSQLLRDADVFSAANSVELRVPFVDLEVLRSAWGLPGRWHLGRFGTGKRVLKALLARMAPRHAGGRAKLGFAFPWDAWLRGRLGDRVATTLGDAAAHATLGLDTADSVRLLAALRGGDARIGWAQVWSRFVLLEWLRQGGLAVPAATWPGRGRATA